MIQDREFLEKWYERAEVEILWDLRCATANLPKVKASVMVRHALRTLWGNELDYIQNAHLITTKKDGVVPLRYNKPQRRHYDAVIQRSRDEGRPIRGMVTKARQQGFSTQIVSWTYEQLDRNPYRQGMIVNYDEPSTAELFGKADFLQANNYCPRPTKRHSGGLIEFASPHSSVLHTRSAGSFEVGRSLTLHYVHATEIPLWPDPDTTFAAVKQAMPTLEDTAIFQEATARGAQGHHYEEWSAAEDGLNEYIPFFSPWFWSDEYTMVFPSEDHKRRFADRTHPSDLQYRERYGLTWEQMHWRHWKIQNDLKGSVRKFKEEYPATASDAFMTTGRSVFDPEIVLSIEHACTPPFWTGDALGTFTPA